MGAVHVLPGTTHSSIVEKGDYDSEKHAALTLTEFEDWLHLEICRYHNTVHEALGRTPLAAWADLGGPGRVWAPLWRTKRVKLCMLNLGVPASGCIMVLGIRMANRIA